MPTYDYRCTACDLVFEITRESSDRSAVVCPECGSGAKRVFTPVGVVFKGSGFYTTDARGKRPPSSEGSDATPSCPEKSAGCAGCPAAASNE